MQPLDNYAMGRSLGAGSFGETFAATHLPTGREVAIKVLHVKDAPDWKAIELFEREGKTLARLQHPGIAAFIDAFIATDSAGGDVFYLVQERIAGESLGARLLRRERMTADEVEALLSEMASVLSYIHGESPPIVHRDLKPSNIMCRPRGERPRFALIDFGATDVTALRADGLGGSTIIGTTGYMPPEQLLGRAVPPSDLYALGATAVHALTGVHPSEMAVKRLRVDWRPHLQTPREVSAKLAAILDDLLAPAVEDRIASATELKKRLRAWARTPRMERRQRPNRDSGGSSLIVPALKLVGSVTVGLLAIIAVSIIASSSPPTPTPVSAPAAQRPSRIPVAPLPAGLIIEDKYPSRLPIRLETSPQLARTLDPALVLPHEAFKLTLRAYRDDTFSSAALLVENTSQLAWTQVRVAWTLVGADQQILASRDGDLVASYESACEPGDVIGRLINWQVATEGVVAIVGQILGAVSVDPVVSAPQPLAVDWAVPAKDGLALSFELLSVDLGSIDKFGRVRHNPRFNVTNTGTAAVSLLRVHKHQSDPSARVAPVDKNTWLIPSGAPSLLPGETRTFSAWSWEDAALSDWSLSLRDVRVGSRL